MLTNKDEFNWFKRSKRKILIKQHCNLGSNWLFLICFYFSDVFALSYRDILVEGLDLENLPESEN